MAKATLIVFILITVLVKMNCTPLDDYVNAPDPNYRYELIETYQQIGFKVFILNMTSQKWMDESFVRNPVWWHYVVITVPNRITRTNAGIVVIDAGKITDGIPDPSDLILDLTSIMATSTEAIVIDVKQVPNQPIVFMNDPTQKGRSEDKAIAWTWKYFLDNPDDPNAAKQLLYLPMTKAIVRAMDASTDFIYKLLQIKLDKFMIAGPSKRGWATWTTMAVDKRVFAAIPIVMDLLNLNTNFHNHFRSLGGWTFAFDSYFNLNITTFIDSYSIFALQKILDPLNYLDRYRNIKILAIVSSGDEFFLIDETHAYWNDLVSATGGSVLLRRIPNAEHTCLGHEISLVFSIRSFFMTVYDEKPLPKISWSRPNNRTHGVIEAIVDISQGPKPVDVKVYYAKTLDGKRKDFRLFIADPDGKSKSTPHPVIWESSSSAVKIKQTATKIAYTVAFPKPVVGWLGFFIQFNFPSVDNSVIVATTETNVIPETYPFDDCTLESCLGKLV